MRNIVQFKQNAPPREGTGFKDSWIDFGTTRGELTNGGGVRNLVSGEVEYGNNFSLTIRYNADYNNSKLLVEIEGRNFTILSIDTVGEGKKRYLKFKLSEKS